MLSLWKNRGHLRYPFRAVSNLIPKLPATHSAPVQAPAATPKVEVNVYLNDHFAKLHGIKKHLRKVQFLATAEELASVSAVQALVQRRRGFLEHADYNVFFNIPGVQLRPRNLAYDKALNLSSIMRDNNAKVLQLFIETTPRHLSCLPFAPTYLKDMPDPSLSDAVTMISFYAFNTIKHPSAAKVLLNELWLPFRALGRVYLAPEGINAQMAVPSNVFDRFKTSLKSVDYLSSIRINVDEEVDRSEFEAYLPFHGLHLRVKDRLVADGGIELDLDKNKIGSEMSPVAWHRSIDNPDAVVIDCRNEFESDVGRFKNAIPLKTENFRESWDALENILKGKSADTQVLTYCTGGIRCVKTNAFIVQKLGFKNVSRLEGGIINYVKHIKGGKGEASSHTAIDGQNTSSMAVEPSKFIGVNYVFDERVCSRVTEDVLTACSSCGKPWDMYTNCNSTECSTRVLLCDSCFPLRRGCCSESCQTKYEDFLRICTSSTARIAKQTPEQLPKPPIESTSESVSSNDEVERRTERKGKTSKMSFQMWRRTKANSYRVTSSSSIDSKSGHLQLPSQRNFSTVADSFEMGLLVKYSASCSSVEPKYLTVVREQTEMKYPSAHHMSCGAYVGRVLAMLSRLRRPKRVLELGAFTGYSALCLAEGLHVDGKVVTIERDPKAAEVARNHFNQSDYSTQIELMEGSAKDLLHNFKNGQMEQFDMVFIDADKNSYQKYCELILDESCPLLAPGGVLVIDNVLWKGSVLHQNSDCAPLASNAVSAMEKKMVEKGRTVHDFNQFISSHPQLTSLMLPIRDGLTIAQYK